MSLGELISTACIKANRSRQPYASAVIEALTSAGFSIVHKDEIHAPSVERINARAEQVMLAVVNEWHRQVGIDEILKSKLTKRIADTVATGVFAAALRELMKEVG